MWRWQGCQGGALSFTCPLRPPVTSLHPSSLPPPPPSCRVKKLSVGTVTALLRIFNLVNAGLLGTACFFAFQIVSGSVTRTFLAIYIGVFAFLLFAFETRMKYTEKFIQRLFGFMFTFSGRAIFLIL